MDFVIIKMKFPYILSNNNETNIRERGNNEIIQVKAGNEMDVSVREFIHQNEIK